MPEHTDPQIHIDSDWKAQAQAEKAKLAEQSKPESGDEGQGMPGEIPPADFKGLLSGLVTQALLYMGGIPDPQTGQRILHMDLARHHIDLLGVIEQKTKGNLDAEESQMLTQALHELRLSFLQLSKQVAEHLKKQATGQAGSAGISPKPSEPKKGGIIY